MLRPVWLIVWIPDTPHQLLLVSEVIAGIGDQVRQYVSQNCLALPLQHSLMKAVGEGEQSPVLLVDLPNADRIGVAPLKHRIDNRIRHPKLPPDRKSVV